MPDLPRALASVLGVVGAAFAIHRAVHFDERIPRGRVEVAGGITVRADPARGPVTLVRTDTVQKGDVVASFTSPGHLDACYALQRRADREEPAMREETEARLRVLQKDCTVVAAGHGQVLWRHSTPGLAKPGAPLLLLADDTILRARFRLARSMAAKLARSKNHDLLAEAGGLTSSRIAASIGEVRDPGPEHAWVDVSFECQLEDEHKERLADGEPFLVLLEDPSAWTSDPWTLASMALVAFALYAATRTRAPRTSS